MAATVDRSRAVSGRLAPLHSFLLGGAITLFIAAMLSDWAYSTSYEIQWNNFASWLIAGALVLTALAVVWGFVDFFRNDGGQTRGLVYPVLLLITWILGFINALVHAKDAWASMPEGLVLSIIVVLLACIAAGAASMSRRTGALS
ncbi:MULTISPECIES: DUF2231 domain-containing protein [Lysobacteraceae]|uniref:DUF2231 domain-containing protein n=1 Tax=Novilysobacter avium TaxID=2781023 RepID=A0A7S6UMC9_9GAMM|nr:MULTISPECIES: DUF2231 domain-containing protein [Lysobacter]QOW22942.1 hypothetical protein INQ42_05120 [Lysobacter avium]QOW25453.1 hypothetical protein INQ43_05400 [Lysobacter sp. H23M47]